MSSLELVNEVAGISREDDLIPNPELGIGRQCYALSDVEDRAFNLLEKKIRDLFETNNVPQDAYEINTDAFGNLFVKYFGTDKSKTIMSGSHLDSVLNGGMFDGVCGVASAYNFLENLVKSKQKPSKNYCLAVFRAEESSPKTGVACLGSAIATGQISREQLENISYEIGGNKMQLRDYFIKKFGEARWKEVLNEIKNPVIRPEEIEFFEELHIEQSAVIETLGRDAGIVVDGIGGARRETYSLPPEKLDKRIIEITDENPYRSFSFNFTGEEAHTGGTPPNPTFNKKEGGDWFRKDALVAAANFGQIILAACKSKGIGVFVKGLNIPKKTGFTTVPTNQTLEFVVRQEDADKFGNLISKFAQLVSSRKGVQIKYTDVPITEGTITALDSSNVFSLLSIPLAVEKNVREMVKDEGGIGKVRATATDFVLNPENGLTFNIDYRSVDSLELTELIDRIKVAVESVFNGEKRVLQSKEHAKISEIGTETKRKIADVLGITFVEMPSMPGHDAASIGYAGIPVSVTFVGHDGRSHNPLENVRQENFETAQKLSHAFLAEMLGIQADHLELAA